jgi:hypothetical protein
MSVKSNITHKDNFPIFSMNNATIYTHFTSIDVTSSKRFLFYFFKIINIKNPFEMSMKSCIITLSQFHVYVYISCNWALSQCDGPN